MKKEAYEQALHALKDEPKVLFIPEEFLDSWELIPDPRLDPFKDYTKRT